MRCEPRTRAHTATRRPIVIGTILVSAVMAGCPPPPCPTCDGGASDASADTVSADASTPSPTSRLDLLLVIDNSMSMRENQTNFMAQLGGMIAGLTRDGAIRDIQVGVVSSDLGTPGATVPGCANSDVGDDGLLNPIRNGQALARHQPWTGAPAGFRPDDCVRPDQFPSFLRFDSSTGNPAQFEHDLRCNVGLYVNGCGLEQQLDAMWRALIWHDARGTMPGALHAGFVRDDALLAIVVLTDEEDMSVRVCSYARGTPCTDGTDVFQMGSTRWAAANLNMRGYMYQPGSDQDPTWSLDRYVDPRDPSRGMLGLKPGHPERVIFAAITGVPLRLPTIGSGADTRTDWNRLLGTPDPANPEDFTRRDTSTAIAEMSAEGPISMRQANLDPNCPDRVVPACRREGSTYDPLRVPCNPTEQYFAWPGRRMVEVARRFDESPLCAGHACRNGIVSSTCTNSFQSAVDAIVARIVRRARGQ